MKHLFAALLLLCVCACQRPGADTRWLAGITVIPTPAAPGSRYPDLARNGDLTLVSWLEPTDGTGYALRFSRLESGRWSAPGTVAAGQDWFINWADFPSVVPVAHGLWVAHWLQSVPGNVYAYEVRIASSRDDGRTWSDPIVPHHDGTPTEHGFVTLLPSATGARAIWLDGRHTAGGHDHEHDGSGAMTLRSAGIAPDGQQATGDVELDARTCDCCQTDAALTDEGAVVVYRDRGEDEVRDIALLRSTSTGWADPVHVADDGWRIDACPVNGPAVDARGHIVAVAWFTAPDRPRVRLAFSTDGGRSFGKPLEVASGGVAGRVDLVLLEDGRAVVSWLADRPGGAEVRVQPFLPAGPAGQAVVVTASSVARSSGFPRMIEADGGLLFAWTETGDPTQVRTAFARLR